MPKPATPFVWATDAVFDAPGEDWDGEANKVAPTAGTIAEGYEPDTRVPADELNHTLNHIGEWTEWLDGLWSGDGDLAMDADADITLSGTGSVVITGTGRYKHSTLTLRLYAAKDGVPFIGGSGYAWDNTFFTHGVQAADLQWVFAVPLHVGKRITAIRARMRDDASPSTLMRFLLRSMDKDTLAYDATIDTSSNTDGSGNLQTISKNVVPTTIAAQKIYEVLCGPPALNGGVCEVIWVEIDYDDL